MNRVKLILNYFISFIISLLILSVSLIIIMKTTILKKDYIKSFLNRNNYYEKISDNILNNMEDYMVSSGLPENVLNNIYNKDNVKNDINNYIDNYFEGKVIKADTTNLEEKLDTNINNYLNSHDLKVTNKNTLELFKKDIASIYQKEVNLYNLINGFSNHFIKLNNIINKILPILIILTIVLILVNIFVNNSKYLGSSISASGIMLILLKIIVIDKIDIQNILIISDEFSTIFKNIFLNIVNDIIMFGIVLIVIGLIVNIFLLRKEKLYLKKK